jgi:autotransporter-associated beta strand protein
MLLWGLLPLWGSIWTNDRSVKQRFAMRIPRITIAVTALAAILSASLPAMAATYTWTGGNGSSNSWYSAGNWAGATVPIDEPASDYVFTASGWNAAQTTIAIDRTYGYPDAQTLTFNGNANVPLTIQIGAGNSLYLSPSSPGATTIAVAQTGVTHTIAGSGGASIQLGGDQQWSVDGDLKISAVIWGDNESLAPSLVKTGAGTLTLSGVNSFAGPISINQGTISVSSIAGKAQACNLGEGDLTLNGGTLKYTGTGSNVSTNRGFTLGAGGGSIDVQNAATSLTFTGAVTGGQAALTKTGSGSLTLAGANNYTGVTTISAGTLEINGARPTTNVLTDAGGVNITGGKLILDYNSGTDPIGTVQSLLAASYSHGFLTGQIRDTSASSSIGLGWVDNTATKQITITPTLYGDADLNGKVDLTDFSILATNFNPNGTGMTWQQGDFDYNGKVDLTDFSILATDFGRSFSAPEMSPGSSLGSVFAGDVGVVPEPSSIVMLSALLALGGVWAIGRRQRNTARPIIT